MELRLRIPDEIKQYQKIISNQEAILSDAHTRADALLAEATAQTNELVNEHGNHAAKARQYQWGDQAEAPGDLIPSSTAPSAAAISDRAPSSIRTIC